MVVSMEAFHVSDEFKHYRWMYILGIPFTSAVILLCLWYLLVGPGEERAYALLGLPLFCWFLWVCVSDFLRWDDYVMIDQAGITYCPSQRPRQFVPWDSIGRVRARDGLQRLELYDRRNTRVMKLEYQLDRFERLRMLVLQYTQPFLVIQSKQTSFDAAPWVSILATAFMLLLLPFVIDSLVSGQTEDGVYGLLFLGLISAGLCWRQIQKLDLKSDHFVIEYCFWRRKRVSFGEISSVSLINGTAPYGGKPAKVFIACTSGQKIELRGFRDGSLAVFDAIESAWKAGRKSGHPDSTVTGGRS